MRATLSASKVARAAVALALGQSWGVLLPAGTWAQETERRVSMEEAIRLFAENSLALRIARSEALEVRGDARQSRSYFNPELSVVREDLNRGADDYWETIIALEQRLEWPARTAARGRAAGHRMAHAGAAYRADSLRLAFEVRRAYVEAWAAEETESVLAATAEAVRRAAQAAERRYEAGDISGYELRRLRVERARIEQAVAAASLAAPEARRILATLILPESEVSEVGPSEPLTGRPPSLSRAEALAALEGRPDLAAAERAADAAAAELSAASQAWIPTPSLSAGYKDQADGLSGATFGLAVPLSIFDRGGGRREAAAARRTAAAALLELRRREARNDLLGAFDRYVSTGDRLESVGEALLGEADELLEIARASYEEGELTVVELVDAAEAFRDARVTAVDLRADTWIAYFDLLRAMGRAPEEDR